MGRKKKVKLTTEEIMERIIDKESLKERKIVSASKNDDEINIKSNEKDKIEIEKKWFEIPMVKDKFIIKEIENKFYAQYEGWKPNVWIGAYNDEQELLDVIKMYIKETKKKPIDRNIKNVHSIIID